MKKDFANAEKTKGTRRQVKMKGWWMMRFSLAVWVILVCWSISGAPLKTTDILIAIGMEGGKIAAHDSSAPTFLSETEFQTNGISLSVEANSTYYVAVWPNSGYDFTITGFNYSLDDWVTAVNCNTQGEFIVYSYVYSGGNCLLEVNFFEMSNSYYGTASVGISTGGAASGGTVGVGLSSTSSAETSVTYETTTSASSASTNVYYFATPNAGYNFMGWATSADSTTAASTDNPYVVSQTFSSTDSASPTAAPTLYAIFKAPTATITSAAQRYPWANKIDVSYTGENLTSASYALRFKLTHGSTEKLIDTGTTVTPVNGAVSGTYTIDLETQATEFLNLSKTTFGLVVDLLPR